MKHNSNNISTRLLIIGTSVSCLLGFASESYAELLAYEGFQYTDVGDIGGTPIPGLPSDLIGKGTADTGWNGTWVPSHTNTQANQAVIHDGSLTYTDSTDGTLLIDQHEGSTFTNRVEVWGQDAGQNTTVGRNLALPVGQTELEIADGKVYYISFMGQRLGEPANPDDTTLYPDGYQWGDNLYPRAAGLRLLTSAGNNSLTGLVGNLSNVQTNTWRFQAGNIEHHLVTDVPFGGVDEPAFVVIRIEYFATTNAAQEPTFGTRGAIWVNPTLAEENMSEALSGTFWNDAAGTEPLIVRVGAIGIEGNNNSSNRPRSGMAIDELRVGTTWAAVTPHEGGGSVDPEPNPDPEDFFAATAVDGWLTPDGEVGPVYIGHYPWIYLHSSAMWAKTLLGDKFADGAYFYDVEFDDYFWTRANIFPWIYVFNETGGEWTY